jgi:tetratricopeptide (TPR) repeat protein
MFDQINGMKMARDNCDTVAAKLLDRQLMLNPKLASFGPSPLQPSPGPDLRALCAQAALAKPVLDTAIKAGLLSLDILPESVITVERPNRDLKTFQTFTAAPLKTAASCQRKIKDDYDGDHSKLADIARCSVVVETEEQLARLLEAFVTDKIIGIKVVRLKNRFASPMFTGIRDCLMNVEIECANDDWEVVRHVGEVQLHFAPILALKGTCHVFYEYFRQYFAGTDGSYKKRLEMFENFGSIKEGVSVEEAIRGILQGDDKVKLEAIEAISNRDVLGDAALRLAACEGLAAIALREKGGDSEEYLKWLFSAGNSYRLKGELGRAEEILVRCCEGSKNALGSSHHTTLSTLHTLGNVYLQKGEYVKALEMFESCYEGRVQTLGDSHPDTLMTINNTALVYDKQGSHGKALKTFERCYAIRKRVLGDDHPEVLDTLNNTATVHSNMGSYEEALEMFSKSYEGQKRVLGEAHIRTLNSLNGIANIYRCQGMLEKALELYSECYEGFMSAVGAGHTWTILCMEGMATLFLIMEDLDRAEEMWLKCVEGRTGILGANHPDVVRSKESLAEVRKAKKSS